MKKTLEVSLTPPPARPVVDPQAAAILASLPAGVTEETPQRRKDDLPAAPWDGLVEGKPKGLNISLDTVLYAKMNWLTHNVPKMSLQKIVMAGTRAEVERMLNEHHYKKP